MHLLPHGDSTFLCYVTFFFVTVRHSWEKHLQGRGFVLLCFWFLVSILAHRFRGHSAVLGSGDCGSRRADRHRSDGAHGRSYLPEERQQAKKGCRGSEWTRSNSPKTHPWPIPPIRHYLLTLPEHSKAVQGARDQAGNMLNRRICYPPTLVGRHSTQWVPTQLYTMSFWGISRNDGFQGVCPSSVFL